MGGAEMADWKSLKDVSLSPVVGGVIIVVVVLIVAFFLWHSTGKPGPNPQVENAIRAEFAHPNTIGIGAQKQNQNPYGGGSIGGLPAPSSMPGGAR
jgi:hypothetical protein